MAVETISLFTTGGTSTSGNGNELPVPAGESVSVFINVFGVSGTTPSVTFEVQWSVDGSTWCSAETPDVFTAITANKKVVKSFTPKGRTMRIAWTMSGTTPNFAFSATAAGQVTDVESH